MLGITASEPAPFVSGLAGTTSVGRRSVAVRERPVVQAVLQLKMMVDPGVDQNANLIGAIRLLRGRR